MRFGGSLRNLLAALRCLGNCLSGRCQEKLTCLDMQPGGPHALDHVEHEQRVATEFEEVVLGADAFASEHLAPDPSHRPLGGCLRLYISA